MPYCTDADLLTLEPRIFSMGASQLITKLSGICMVVDTGAMYVSRFPADGVPSVGDVVLIGSPDFVALAIGGADTSGFTISAPTTSWRAGLFESPSVANDVNISFVIKTFPQLLDTHDMLDGALGLLSSSPKPVVLNPQALRRPAALATLASIFRSLNHFDRTFHTSEFGDLTLSASVYWRRAAESYEARFKAAIRNVKIELDTNGDGKADVVKRLAEVSTFRR